MNPQQPQYGAPMPPPMAAPNRWGPTSFGGIEAHVLAGLTYLSMFVISIIGPLIVFFVEKNNRFVKFHAAQAILLGIAAVVLDVVAFIVWFGIIAASSAAGSTSSSAAANAAAAGFGLGSCLLFCIVGLGALAILAGTIWGAVAAFSGQTTKLPLIGNIAEKWAGGPVTPAY